MKLKPDSYAHVDDEGRLIIPAETASRLGLQPGAVVPFAEEAHNLLLRLPPTHLKKVYLEVTNRCNLDCRMCIRRTWDEPVGQMAHDTFRSVIAGLQAFSPAPAIFFGGFGEPLSHPDIIDMVAEAKSLKNPVELITNATLLSPALSKRLTAERLDVLWVSLEGAKPESYADVRLGGELPNVLDNIRRFRDSRQAYHTEIGVVFVAMKRNIAELPDVMRLAKELGATRFLVTNVLPYTEDLREEALYSCEPEDLSFTSPAANAGFELCRMDSNDITRAALQGIIRNARVTDGTVTSAGDLHNYCPFIESGSLAISWDGGVSPCLPLMHNHTSYLGERKRCTRRLIAGNVSERNLSDIWDAPEYLNIRRRVQAFYFASCTTCKGCELAEKNETDCLGSGFPACGGCLWAQGFIRCP